MQFYLIVLPIWSQQENQHPAISWVFQQQLARTAALGGEQKPKTETVSKHLPLNFKHQSAGNCILMRIITLWAKLLKRLKYWAQFFTFSGTSLSNKESRASVKLSRPGSPKWRALSRVFSRMDATTTRTSLTLHSNKHTLKGESNNHLNKAQFSWDNEPAKNNLLLLEGALDVMLLTCHN